MQKFMKDLFRDIKKDKMISISFLSNVLLIVIAIVYIFFSYKSLPPFVPVFNQLPWGEQRLGDTYAIFIPILTSILIFVINIFLCAFFYKKIPLISRMLAIFSLLTGILIFLFTIRTILLII